MESKPNTTSQARLAELRALSRADTEEWLRLYEREEELTREAIQEALASYQAQHQK